MATPTSMRVVRPADQAKPIAAAWAAVGDEERQWCPLSGPSAAYRPRAVFGSASSAWFVHLRGDTGTCRPSLSPSVQRRLLRVSRDLNLSGEWSIARKMT
jgi:hypothetical protein